MKYLFVFLIGFCTHKVLNTTYSYLFWSTRYACAAKTESGKETAICADEKLKVINTIAKYTITYVSYTMGHWGLTY